MTKPLTQAQQQAQLRRLELATRSVDNVPPAQRLEWAVYQLILAAAGINPATLEWDGSRYDANDVRQHLIDPLRHIGLHLQAEVPGFVPLSLADKRPIHAMGRVLKVTFGLEHHLVGSHRLKRYIPDAQLLEQRRTLLLKRRQDA